MGSDSSHFDVSPGSDGQSHKTVSTNHNLFEEKGEPKRYRTEVLPLTNALPLGKTGSLFGKTHTQKNMLLDVHGRNRTAYEGRGEGGGGERKHGA